MKKRLAKKVAKRYLDTGEMQSKYVLSVREYKVFDTPYWKTELTVSEPVRVAIYSEATRRGWDGNHWDDPLVISIESEKELA